MGAKRGTEHHLAKLDPATVREIRALRADGLSFEKITDAIGWRVSTTTVRGVISGRLWSHVPDEEEEES